MPKAKNAKNSADKEITNFLFELGMFKKIHHCGTMFAGVKTPDTLGEHTCRAAQIGFLLAMEENANPEKVASICLLHDVAEIRIGDAHRIAKRYIETAKAERTAFLEQTAPLPEKMKTKLRALWDEFDACETREAQVARDADLLETMIQAKEYMDIGFTAAKRWLENGNKYLKTATAKKWFQTISSTKFTDWWDKLNSV
jgi:putative hydrolase of HD superfamily